MSTDIAIYQSPRHMTLDQSILAWLDEKRADIKITSDYLEEHLSYENPLAAELEEE
jgi:hypothetical protein